MRRPAADLLCCTRVGAPPLNLGNWVLGHRRVKVEAMDYVVSLRAVGPLPLRAIRWPLGTWHGLYLSVGALVRLLAAMSQRAAPPLDALQAQVRNGPADCANEMGWRGNRQPDDIWVLSVPALRYFHYAYSRAGAVVQKILGEVYGRTLVSDFHAGYPVHEGPYRCHWVHPLRDIHNLRAAHPADAELAASAVGVHDLYLMAKQVAPSNAHSATQVVARADIQRRLTDLWKDGWQPDSTLPQVTLCQRTKFVLDPALPSDNNLTKRSLQPLVIARKVSDGGRSEDASTPRMAFASLGGIWLAQGSNPVTACHNLLLASALLH